MGWVASYRSNLRSPPNLIWDAPSGGPTPDGSRLYWGTSTGSHPNGPYADVGGDRRELLSILGVPANVTVFIIARSYIGGTESSDSNEIQVRNGVQIA